MASDWIGDLLDALDEIATEHNPYECGLPTYRSVGDDLRAAVQQCFDRQIAAERARVVGREQLCEQHDVQVTRDDEDGGWRAFIALRYGSLAWGEGDTRAAAIDACLAMLAQKTTTPEATRG